MKLKKMVMGAGALAIAAGMMAVVQVGPAVAKASSHKTVTGTGAVTCTGIKGTITFKPPLTNTGNTAETASIKVTISSCSGGTPTPTKGTDTGTIQTTTNSCTALATPNPSQTETLTTKWAPKMATTIAHFGPDVPVTSPNVGFSLSGGTTSGSFAGSGNASANVTSSETSSQLTAACAGKGLSKLTLNSGTVTFG